MLIRDAVAADFEHITAIYNSIVLTSTAIYNDIPATLENRLAWWQGRVDQSYPFLVAVEGDTVLGYATFGDFRTWPGYRFTVEGTVHVREGVRGKGIGTQLLTELAGRARALRKHRMIAGVDAENIASLRFLEGFGFTRAGLLREVGYKFDRYLDLCFLQYSLDPRGPVGSDV
jgi:L-amino acid N-acyltransferase YncA